MYDIVIGNGTYRVSTEIHFDLLLESRMLILSRSPEFRVQLTRR